MAGVSENVSMLASKIWRFSLDRLLINFRFLDVALSSIKLKEQVGLEGVSCDISTPDKSTIYYNPTVIIRLYKKNPNNITRLHLHILLHCIFSHSYKYNKVDKDLWDLASDMAVENTVLSMGLTGFDTFRDKERREVLEIWHGKIGNLTADRIYRKLREEGLGVTEILELSLLFKRDEHDNWAEAEVLEISEAQWKKIS
jgi:predicted metal-dependent peptidase